MVERANTEDLKSSVRKDLQVRILPPLPWLFRESDAAARALDLTARTYSFLLGIYLGDGHKTLLPERSVALVRHQGAIAVSTYFVGWPWLFPQHGPGRNHTRRILLEARQQEVVARYPAEFFTSACDMFGIHWRRASQTTISIARRADVARLDALFGYRAPSNVDATN